MALKTVPKAAAVGNVGGSVSNDAKMGAKSGVRLGLEKIGKVERIKVWKVVGVIWARICSRW